MGTNKRVGIIGAGWVATARHVPSFERAHGADLVAVFDRKLERAVAGAPAAVAATDDLDAFFDQELDIVSVCTSPWSHPEFTIAALERGIHVLCEKPMAVAVTDAEAMIAAAEEHDRLLCLSHNFLWSKAMTTARARLAAAGGFRYAAGVQLSSEARRLPTWYQDLPGGLLFDEIPHMLYILDDLLGSELVVEDVRAEWAGRPWEPQSCEVLLRGKRGPGQLTMVFDAPVSEWHVTTVSSGNVIDVDLFRDVMVATGSDGAHTARDVLGTSLRLARQHLGGFAAAGLRLARRRQYWGHDGLVQAFVDAVMHRGPSPVAPAHALSVMRTAATIVEAMEPQR